MKWTIAGLTCMVAFGFAVAGEDADIAKKIVGVWEVTKAEGAPPGSTIEFTKDGKIKVKIKIGEKELAIDGTYKLKGKSVTMAVEFGGVSKSETNKIVKLTEKELIVEDEKGKTEEYKRK